MLPATARREQLVHDNLQVQENWQVSLPTSIHSFVAYVPDAHAILGSNVHMERERWSDVTRIRLKRTTCHDNLQVQESAQVSLPTSIHSFVACVPDALAILGSYMHVERVLWSDVTRKRLKRTTCHDNLQVQENWQVSLPTSIYSFVACVPEALRFLDPMCTWSVCAEVMLPATAWREQLVMTTCKYRKVGKSPFPLLSTASLRVCQTPLIFLDPICTWSESAEVMLPASAWREQLVMTTCKCRKVRKFPFPLLSTASLRVCQTPLLFLDPICTWSECAEVMLPATAWREQVQESWQVSLPTSIHSFVACVPDAPAILGSYMHMERERWSDATCNHLKRTACSWQSARTRKLESLLSPISNLQSRRRISNLGSRISRLRSHISDIESRILNLGSRIWEHGISDLPSRISDLGSRILDLGSGISDLDLECRISDLGSRTSDLGSRILDLGSGISESRISDRGSRILDLGSGISDLGSRISNLGSRISDLGSGILDLESRISDRGSRILDLGSGISDLGSRISNLGSRISDLGSGILDLESRISDLESRISNLESRISNLESRISDLESRISDLGSRISDLGSGILDLESRISDLGSRISDLGSRISNLSVAKCVLKIFAPLEAKMMKNDNEWKWKKMIKKW